MKLNKFILLFFIATSMITSNCSNDNDVNDCGCESQITSTIIHTSELIGNITFKSQTPSNSYYTNKYWITYVDPNCSNCVLHMIICNEGFISNDILNSLKTQTSISVKFAGELREVCEKRFDIADITYKHITLTKIEKQ